MKNVNEMSTVELVAEYNVLTGKNIKKFSGRVKAEEQVLKQRFAAAMQAQMDDDAKQDAEADRAEQRKAKKGGYDPVTMEFICPGCGVNHDQTFANDEETRLFCHHCSTEYYQNGRIYKAQAKSAKRSQSISETWNDKEIAEKRAKRHQVRVVGAIQDRKIDQVFNSVPSAFKALGLPYQKHIAFRGSLVKAGRAEFGSFNFEIV